MFRQPSDNSPNYQTMTPNLQTMTPNLQTMNPKSSDNDPKCSDNLQTTPKIIRQFMKVNKPAKPNLRLWLSLGLVVSHISVQNSLQNI